MVLLNECSALGCYGDVLAKGLCPMHYFRQRRTGTTRRLTPEQRFWLRVSKIGHDGCWLWIGAVREGHGYWRGRKAHRVAYEYLMGSLGGRTTEHACGQPLCVRPAHLRLTARRTSP